MSEQQIKFMVNRIYAKDISLESPESPKIFNELKLQPKVGFNLNTSIEKIEENTFDVTLNISIKALIDMLSVTSKVFSSIFSIEVFKLKPTFGCNFNSLNILGDSGDSRDISFAYILFTINLICCSDIYLPPDSGILLSIHDDNPPSR